MSTQVMLQGHLQATLQRAAACTDPYLVAVQDTTFYNYSTHDAMQGLGTLQAEVRGVLQHNVLLLNQKGVPLGLIDQQYWSRQQTSLPYKGKESLKWSKGLKAVNKQLGATPHKVVLVQDREADIFSFFKAQRAPNVELLVRVHQPRNMEVIQSGAVLKFNELQDHLAVAGYKQVEIMRQGKAIRLTLSLQAGRVHVLPDKGLSKKKHKTQPLSLIIARETAAVDEKGQDVLDEHPRAEWHLLTSLAADSEQEIDRVVDFYALRWRIERFHYTLKSGALKVERLQFDDLHTTIHALSFYSVVAWQLLSISYQIREDSQAAAQGCFDEVEIKVLEQVANKKISTVEEAVQALGRIVGFARSKKQPLPGVRVLAQALERLYYMKKGYQAASP